MSGLGNSTDSDSGSSTAIKATEATVLCIIICICVVGNVSLWIVVLRSKTLRTVTSMFILGLSAADLFVATINMPLTVYSIIVGYWSLSDSACVVFGFFNMLTLVSSVLSLCNISINRYFMVVKPTKFKDIYTTRNAVLMILAVFTVSILLSSPPLIGWSKYRYIPIQSFCFADWENHMWYAFFMIGCCFGIPFGVMTVCNIIIFRTVQKSRQRVKMVITNASPKKSTVKQTPSETFNTSEMASSEVPEQLTFTDVESFPVANSVVDDNETTEKHLQDLNESTDDNPLYWESNKLYKPKTDINKNGTESDSSTHEEKPWPERTLLKVETSFKSSVDIRTVSTHWADTSMLAHKDINSSTASENVAESDDSVQRRKPPKRPISQNFLHPNWKSKDKKKRITISSATSTETTITTDISSDIAILETSVTSNTSQSSDVKRRSILPRSPSLRRREEIRLATTLAIVVLLFVLCWLPYCVSMLLSIFHPSPIPRGFHMFTLLIGYANSGCNPIVYGVMNKRFKIGYQRLFCFCKQKTLFLNSDSPSY